MFGRVPRASRADGGAGAPANAPARDNDHHARIELDLQDAYHGAERSVTCAARASTTTGQLPDDERHLQIKIPKGVFEGQHIRQASRGKPASAARRRATCCWRCCSGLPPEGRDVHQRLLVSSWEALLGGSVKVRAPGGETEVTLPTGKAGRKAVDYRQARVTSTLSICANFPGHQRPFAFDGERDARQLRN